MKSATNVSRVVERKSFKDFIVAMNYHVDVKEWSEVGGVYEISRRILKHFDPELIMDVGCGKRPTLATLMALNYKCDVVAVDPQLDDQYSSKINRLVKVRTTLLEYAKSVLVKRRLLLLANHSHAPKYEIMLMLSKSPSWVYVTVPCCVDNKLSNEISIHFKDIHMHSDKNEVFVFSNNQKILSKTLLNE